MSKPVKQTKRKDTTTKASAKSAGWFERYGWLLLIVVPFLLYAVTLTYKITQLDDYIFIFDKDPFNNKFSNITRIFSIGVFSEKDIYYRPLFLASFLIERLFVDLQNAASSLAVYHFTNIALHVACVLAVHRFLKIVGVEAKVALLLALLYAVHPALTMAVAWIPGRNDSMLTLFALGFFVKLHAYIRDDNKTHLFWQFLFFMAALFTKETALFIPAVATIYLWSMKIKPIGKRSLFVHATWIPVVVIWWVLRNNVLDEAQDARTIGERIADAVHRLPAYLVYVGKVFFPFNLNVFPSLDNETIWFGVAAVAVIGALFYFTLRNDSDKEDRGFRTRKMLLGLAWFVIFIFPFLLVPPKINDQVFEHRLYLPMIGLLIFLGHTFLFNGSLKFNRVATASALVGVLFVVLTVRYLPLFNSPIKFWENAVAASPNSSYAHKLLGARYNEANMKDKALPQFKIAYALNKDEKHARYFIARDELEPAGKNDEAMKLLYEEIKINPTYTEAYFELSHLYFMRNQTDSTLKYLLLSRDHQPVDPMINNNLLLTFINRRDYDGAKKQVAYMKQNGLTVDPNAERQAEALKQ